MAISVDWPNRVVESTASILDLVAFKDTIRDLEDDAEGMLYPGVITYKQVDLGGGAFFHAVDFINGYTLRFPSPGNYEIVGNLKATIEPVAGVYVERKTSAAFATTSSGGSGVLTPEQATMLEEIHLLLGLDGAKPLVVDEVAGRRRVPADGSVIDQVLSEVAGVVTVTRQ